MQEIGAKAASTESAYKLGTNWGESILIMLCFYCIIFLLYTRWFSFDGERDLFVDIERDTSRVSQETICGHGCKLVWKKNCLYKIMYLSQFIKARNGRLVLLYSFKRIINMNSKQQINLFCEENMDMPNQRSRRRTPWW